MNRGTAMTDAADTLKVMHGLEDDLQKLGEKVRATENLLKAAVEVYCDAVKDTVKEQLLTLSWQKMLGSRHKDLVKAAVPSGPLQVILDNVHDKSSYYFRGFAFNGTHVSCYQENDVHRKSHWIVEAKKTFIESLGVKFQRRTPADNKRALKLLKDNGLDAEGLAKLLQGTR
jgi:hypothetical protein